VEGGEGRKARKKRMLVVLLEGWRSCYGFQEDPRMDEEKV